ncbi:MAG: hypothetical protein E7481_00420 [Ruminococcaceae bacterium]|nr:hypothetical protein [Oscillospiraceae bacterium]
MKKFLAVMFSIFSAVSLIGAAADKPESFVLKGENGPSIEFSGKSQSAAVEIVYPDGSNALIVEYAQTFAERLSETIGSEVTASSEFQSYLKSSWVYRIFIGGEYDNHLYVEYLNEKYEGLLPFILDTEEEWAKFCGTANMFSMWVDEEGLHINASDEWALYWAIDDFLKEIRISESYVLAVGTKILPSEDYVFPDPTDLIGKGLNPYFAITEKVAELPVVWYGVNLSDYNEGLQGGYTDGEYGYVGTDGPGDMGRIFKYSLPDWELVEVSDPLLIKHSNAISYIKDKNLLTVAHCTDGDVRGFAYVDPNTLEVVSYGETPIDCWGLEYDNANERFIVEVNWIHYIFDKDFNYIKELPYGDMDGTPQTLFVDGKYIYDVRYNVNWDTGHSRSTPDPTFGQNYITIHDYDNVYIEKAPIPNLVGEAEHMYRYGNKYYIGYIDEIINGKQNDLGTVYETLILPEVWWE